MELTKEQLDIIHSSGNIKINAIAGSGKTTTIIEYAKSRPSSSKILYLAFNKSVKLEAIKKFSDKEINNVKVETAHSLAYRHIVFNYGYNIRPLGYRTNEITELLNLEGRGKERHAQHILANHINKFTAYFCNSNKRKVQELNYLDIVYDQQAKSFVSSHYEYIEAQTRLLLSKMNTGEIGITHDFYLKKFQLSKPKLEYDYILFDEGQDASPVMLDVFFSQPATKVIVGDTHQQIYGWRFAVNSLEQADFKTHHLSTSFRFGQDIANLAIDTLKLKEQLGNGLPISIKGKGTSHELKSKAILARTNLGLLLKAIEYVTENHKVKHLYFEGNFNSYTYADEGASLYDVLNLYNEKKHLIRDNLIKSMKDLDELEDYIKKTEDAQLGMMVEIVMEYGSEIPGIIKSIKEKHVGNDEKDKAEMVFSTVHRCKGMEYDSVQLVNDFITKDKLESILDKEPPDEVNLSKLNEEINLLYVAITRAKNKIRIPEPLMPIGFPPSQHIHVLKSKKSEDQNVGHAQSKTAHHEKSYSMMEVRTKHKDAYKPWTPALDSELTLMVGKGKPLKEIAQHFGRTTGAIVARMNKLENSEAQE